MIEMLGLKVEFAENEVKSKLSFRLSKNVFRSFYTLAKPDSFSSCFVYTFVKVSGFAFALS